VLVIFLRLRSGGEIHQSVEVLLIVEDDDSARAAESVGLS